MTTTSNSKTELPRIDKVVIAEDGDKFLRMQSLAKSSEELLNTIDELLADKARLIKEIDKMIGKDLEKSFALQDALEHTKKQASKITIMHDFIRTNLQIFEAAFDSDENVEAQEVLDYLTQAKWMRDNYGRANNSIKEVQEYYDNLDPWKKPSIKVNSDYENR